MSVSRTELETFLNSLLDSHEFQDYGPNGLQIEGVDTINKIAFAVSATADSVSTAVKEKADCLVVHHGLFWKFHGTRTLTGPFAKRVKPLVQNEINLFGYHLPLDAHIEHGNAASVAAKIGMQELSPYGDYKGSPTGVKGKLKTPQTAAELQEKIKIILNHSVILSTPDSGQKIESLAIITGGANGDWIHCLNHNVDAYLTGEISEHDWHEAKEAGIHMFAGGHHATEQFGIQSLQKVITDKFKVEAIYIDSQNPA